MFFEQLKPVEFQIIQSLKHKILRYMGQKCELSNILAGFGKHFAERTCSLLTHMKFCPTEPIPSGDCRQHKYKSEFLSNFAGDVVILFFTPFNT